MSSHATSAFGQIYENEARAKITAILFTVMGTQAVLSDLTFCETQPVANRKNLNRDALQAAAREREKSHPYK